MHVELFAHGISVLRRVEAQQQPFRIISWVADTYHPMDCGTAACAAGWMCRDPAMNEAGLQFWHGVPAVCDADRSWEVEGRALTQFFGISLGDALCLFMPSYYAAGLDTTAAMVADRMQAMLDAHLQAQPVDWSEPVAVKDRELELA